MTCHASDELENSTDELLAQARSGDREAFGLIFERHQRFIYKFIYAMLGEHHLAEELTQETFLGAFKGIRGLRGEAALRTWLCGIAKNLVYKSFRGGRGRSEASGDALEKLNLSDDQTPPPDRQVLNRELNRRIAHALGQLNADRRLIFVLKEMQNLSYKEIAEITGSAVPKLKTDLFRAKNEMRGMLRPYLEADHEL